MAELRPYPFAALARRMFRELAATDSIFDLPARKFFVGSGVDTSVRFHGKRASSPLGPAAGPQTQMAQNLVLSYLSGCRVMELKTVQIMDELVIPRPCIDMETVGFNVEWSQELKLEQSLEEYVKGSMLIEILAASGAVTIADDYKDTVLDMSVGYDLKGIQSERVQAFIHGMLDATSIVNRLRAELPDELAAYRDLDFTTRLADTLTLSTFHGCPPEEIERIIEFLLEENRLNCVIKLNPTLLGAERCRGLLNDQLGYHGLHIPDTAFAQDAHWDQAVAFVDRLGAKANGLGLGFGVKFSNTLIVENHRDFFPAEEKQMYLSGQPLHVLAMNLVGDFRAHFGDTYPISFSAGIDRQNFADAVAIGLVPITVCSDLLRPGGYARASGYMEELSAQMNKLGATTIDEYILRAYGNAEAALECLGLAADDPLRTDALAALANGTPLAQAAGSHYGRWVSEAALLNTRHYVAQATADVRYARAKNAKPPRKLGSHLALLDCVTCSKCVPVCPNHANFIFTLPQAEIPIIKLRAESAGWSARHDGVLTVAKKQQYGNFADFCNECGNCDVFCPEDGGPYVIKPRFFGSRADFAAYANKNGFYFEQSSEGVTVLARIGGLAFELRASGDRQHFSGEGFVVSFDAGALPGACAGDNGDSLVQGIDGIDGINGSADREVDLTYVHLMALLRDHVYLSDDINYLSLLR